DTQVNDRVRAVRWARPLAGAAGRPGRLGQLTADQRRLAIFTPRELTGVDAATGAVLYQKPLADAGIDGWLRAAGSGDRLAFLLPRGKLVCLNVAEGRVAWQGSLRDGNVARFQVEGELLLVSESRGAAVTAYDLRTGRALPVRSGAAVVETML